jgi:hypothetical protein
MVVVTYTTTDPDCPEGSRALARIFMPIPTKGGKSKPGFLPVLINAADAQTARKLAEDFYASELAKAEERAGRPRGRPKKAEPAPTSIVDEAVI